MTSWLFNFSVSHKTGSMRRIMETIRFFDENGGATFILNSSLTEDVRPYNAENKYFFFSPTVLERFLKNENYIKEVVAECGQPDIYFSYGIPIYQKVGRLNWLHISNALSLTVKNIILPAETKIKMLLLKHRIRATVNNIDVVSGESQYTLDLFQREIPAKKLISHQILRNGYSSEDMSAFDQKTQTSELNKYAMTIGVASYKRLNVVYDIYKQLQATNKNIKSLYVVHGALDIPYLPRLIPKKIKLDRSVAVKTFERREDLVAALNNSDYYISASQIENSSNALLEGLIFSKRIIATDIPSHRELIVGKKHGYFKESITGEEFIFYKKIGDDLVNSISWKAVLKEMTYVGNSLL